MHDSRLLGVVGLLQALQRCVSSCDDEEGLWVQVRGALWYATGVWLLLSVVALSRAAFSPDVSDARLNLCVQVDPEVAAVTREDLAEAIRARMDRRQVELSDCAGDSPGETTWRLDVKHLEDDRVRLAASGVNLRWDTVLPTGQLSPHEVVQLIALSFVEVARDAVDTTLLEQLGFIAELSVEQVAPDRADARAPEPCPELTCPPCRATADAAASPPHHGLILVGGPMSGLDVVRFGGYAALRLDVDVSGWSLRPHIGARAINGLSSGAAELSELGLEAGVGFGRRLEPLTVALGLQSRVTRARLGAVADPARVSFFWDAGASAEVTLWLWQYAGLRIGVAAQAWAWAQPRRYLVQGEALGRQARWEIMMGPSFRHDLRISN